MSASGSDEQVVAAQGADPEHPAASARLKRKWPWRPIAFIVLVVLVYLAVISLYAPNGRSDSWADNEAKPATGVIVQLKQDSVNASAETISMSVNVIPSTELEVDGSSTLAQDVTVIISPVSGEQTITLAKDTIPGIQSINVLAPGAIENWPFDRYDARMVVIAYIVTDGVEQAVPTTVELGGYLPGWNISNSTSLTGQVTVSTPDGLVDWPVHDLSAGRSGSTLAFAIVLLSLMVVMPVLVLFVAITAYRGHRKVEPSFLSWMGAMLFATIPLRSFLPGSPPIGSWIDFLIVLWVIVGLVAGLAIYVRAWVRWGTPSTPPPPTPSRDGTIRP
ncbi:MAG: hypothetical protein JWQ64_2550 [Subtercola sp.]|nr:hypothetical protein [Subtercola sp.]